MRVLWAFLLVCFILFAGEAGCPQSLSTLILPSEDELIEAFNNGEIDYEQFVILLDLIQQGVDSSDYYLLDEIPNLTSLQPDSQSIATELESDQSSAFVKKRSGKSGGLGRIDYRYLQSLERDRRASYRLSSSINLSPTWKTSFQVRREYSGRERWVSRSAEYRRSEGFVRRLIFGTFNARLGLGTVYGYRGKLVSFSDRLDRESFLYPDYGGFNGVYVKGITGKLQIEGIGSSVRDDGFSVSSAGGAISYQAGRLKPGLVVGLAKLSSRDGGASILDGKCALNTSLEYDRGYSRAEVVTQAGHGKASWSTVVEGKHKAEQLEITYSGWSYSDKYLNLTGGGKSAAIYCRARVGELEFDCSDRRAGQSGGQIRAAVKPHRSWRMVGSAIVATRDRGNRNVDLLGSAQYFWTRRVSTQFDYLTRNRKRTANGDPTESSDRRWRLDTRIQSGKLILKSYISYTWDSDDGVYTSVFVSVKRALPSIGNMEFWSNFGRIRSGKLEYWYLFAKMEQQLLENVSMAVKFAHSYRRSNSRSSQPSISLELEARL